jgi:presequence protease
LDCLHDVVDKGVPQTQVEAALHQLELSQREIGGDGYPYGLQLILSSLSGTIHRGDALALLNWDAVLKQLHEDIRNPRYIPDLVKILLLDNPHRVRLVLAPDKALAQHRDADERQKLQHLMSTMTEAELKQIQDKTRTLLERQQQADDAGILPKLNRDDIPLELAILEPTWVDSTQRWTFYDQCTNGLVYHQLVMDLASIPQAQMPLLSLLSRLITEVGLADEDYLQIQARQASICGNLAAHISLLGGRTDENDARGFFILSIKGLMNRQDAIAQLLVDTLAYARFDELRRIRELVSQLRARKQQSIVQAGHSLAIGAAGQHMSCINQTSYRMSGLAGIKWLQQLDDSLTETVALEKLSSQLTDLLQLLQSAPQKLVSISESQYQQRVIDSMASQFGSLNTQPSKQLRFVATGQVVKQVWITNSQVNFCARVFKSVAAGHADAAPLMVLGDVLRNGFLHRAVREQGGAYGAGASQDSGNACFRFYSYRDPRSAETMADFGAAVDWVLGPQLTQQYLEEAVLGVISSIDKPGSPAGEALQAYESTLHGRTPAHRKAFRAAILKVSLSDLQRVAKQYLLNHEPSEAVIASAGLKDDPYFSAFEQFQI